MCVCLWVQTITFEPNDLWPSYLACWFILTCLGQVRRSRSQVKVHSHRRKQFTRIMAHRDETGNDVLLLWPWRLNCFDFITGPRVTSDVGNLHVNFVFTGRIARWTNCRYYIYSDVDLVFRPLRAVCCTSQGQIWRERAEFRTSFHSVPFLANSTLFDITFWERDR